MFIFILKLICLFLVVVYGLSILIRCIHQAGVTGTQIVLFAVGLIGFLQLQYNFL